VYSADGTPVGFPNPVRVLGAEPATRIPAGRRLRSVDRGRDRREVGGMIAGQAADPAHLRRARDRMDRTSRSPWGACDCAFRDPSGNMVRIAQA